MKIFKRIFERTCEWGPKKYMVFWMTIAIIGMSPLLYSYVQEGLFFDEVLIEGKITNVRTTEDHLYLSFNNETKEYKIDYPKNNVDFTVNSKMMIKLHKSHNWLNTGQVYTYSFVKVPSEG